MLRRRMFASAGAVFAAWVTLGILRAGAVAQDAFVRIHEGTGLVHVEISGPVPVPPLWAVTVSGGVLETGATTPVYRSTMILLVEPLSGWSATFAAG